MYADITHITPRYTLSAFSGQAYSLICECETTDGESIWIYISTSNYEYNFFKDYTTGGKKKLNNVTRVLGRMWAADEVSSDLESHINQDTIIYFSDIINI